MTPFLWGVLVGVFIGANVGLLVLSLLVAAKDGDRHLDPVTRKQAADEQRVWDAINRKEEPHGQEAH
ncbi:MAG: hypothetical protein M0R28_21445 [Pigmentiphaga sp.]|nr:hypothetical protein [Pigmentiphaga sp.]